MAKPRVITERTIQPIYQRIVNRPFIFAERVVPSIKLRHSQPQIQNRQPTVAPTRFTTSQQVKNLTIPGNKTIIQKVVKPHLLIQNQLLQIRQSRPQIIKHRSRVTPTQRRISNSLRTVQVPGAQIHTQKIVQPLIQQESVNLQIRRGRNQIINHKPVVAQPIIRNRVRTQIVPVPGKQIINQPIHTSVVKNLSSQVKLVQSPSQYLQNRPIVQPTRVTRSVRHVNHPIVKTIPVEKIVHVKQPYIKNVPVVQYEPVYVDSETGIPLQNQRSTQRQQLSQPIINNQNYRYGMQQNVNQMSPMHGMQHNANQMYPMRGQIGMNNIRNPNLAPINRGRRNIPEYDMQRNMMNNQALPPMNSGYGNGDGISLSHLYHQIN